MSFCFEYDFQKWTLLSLGLIAATLIVGLVLIQGGHGQTNNNNSEENENAARTYLSCYDGTMSTFLLQTLFGPPEIKFNLTDLMSPEVKQYISDSCKFYHEKSGVWLSGTDNELDKQIVSKYRAEFMQKVKEPDSLIQRDQAYIQLNKTN
jgi:hypothetical protein